MLPKEFQRLQSYLLFQAVQVNARRQLLSPGRPLRLRCGDAVDLAAGGQRSGEVGSSAAFLVPLDFRKVRHARSQAVPPDALVTVDCKSQKLRPGDCLQLGDGQTCTLDGATVALESDEALVVLCPPPNEEVVRANRKAAEKASAPRRQSFSEDEVRNRETFHEFRSEIHCHSVYNYVENFSKFSCYS